MHSPFNDHKTLIKELRAGNEDAYKFIFKTHYEDLVLYTTSLTNDVSQAEDIVQNAFVKLWTQRTSLKIHTSVKNYLFRSVYNAFVIHCRKEKRRLKLLEDITIKALQELSKEEDAVLQERLERIGLAIAKLPPRCREIFLLSKQEGLLYKEIAAKLNISVKTVETQMGRAFAFIRKYVAENSKEP